MNSNRQAPLRKFHATSVSSLVCAKQEVTTIGWKVRRLPSLCKGDSLKVGQPAPLSSRMIGQPLFYQCKRLRCFHLLYKVKAGKARRVILRVSTRCYLNYIIFPPDSIILDHLPVVRHSVQDPIRYTCILIIVGTNKEIKQHLVYFIPDYRRHPVTWHLAASHIPDYCRHPVTWHLAASHTLHIVLFVRISFFSKKIAVY